MNKKEQIDTSEVIELLKSYRQYKNVIKSLEMTKCYYSSDHEDFKGLMEQYQSCIKLIEDLIESFAPSNIFIILNLYYLNGVPLDKCSECMGTSRATTYRLFRVAKIAAHNRYQRMKKGFN